MLLVASQKIACDGLEPQVGGVRMCEREQVLGVEETTLVETRGHITDQKVALELGVVSDEEAPLERLREWRRNLFDRRCVAQVFVLDPGERTDHTGHRGPGVNARLDRRQLLAFGVEQHRTDFYRFGGVVTGESGRLEVDDRDGSHYAQEFTQRRQIDVEISGRVFANGERRERGRGSLGLFQGLSECGRLSVRDGHGYPSMRNDAHRRYHPSCGGVNPMRTLHMVVRIGKLAATQLPAEKSARRL